MLPCASQSNLGFTLIELLVVITITGMLAAIALPTFLSRANSAKQAEAKTYIGTLNRAQQAYAIEYSRFSDSPAALGLHIRDHKNYKYEIKVDGNGSPYAVHYADSQAAKLPAYVGMTAFIQGSDGTPALNTVLCKADLPQEGRATAPIYNLASVECAPGTQDAAKSR
ncbi:prepilin-type N-terminal cleavage/methylation domain-containing protein [Phormidium sp. CLA17]|nr:prepilin-type N-terminal cleavage/methylation domain-containing protein [Leptolyngbya sp. Cla-17]